MCIISFLGLLSLFWAFMPFLGWSHYSIEGARISCSVQWREKSLNVISYNICIFIFVYIVPFGVIIFTNYKFLKRVRKNNFIWFKKIIFSFLHQIKRKITLNLNSNNQLKRANLYKHQSLNTFFLTGKILNILNFLRFIIFLNLKFYIFVHGHLMQ